MAKGLKKIKVYKCPVCGQTYKRVGKANGCYVCESFCNFSQVDIDECRVTVAPTLDSMSGKYIDAQREVIKKYRVRVYAPRYNNRYCIFGSTGRTHAHIVERVVCKWTPSNTIQSTFTLFHEIGHIETTTSKMRRAEEEYYAKVWAIERCKEYGFEIPKKVIKEYQEYIDMEKSRGVRRGGTGYADLVLSY